MAAEGWCDGTWKHWRWKTPGHPSSSSSSTPQAGWMWHDCGRPSFGQTRVGDYGVRSLTPPVVIDGSMVVNGPNLFFFRRHQENVLFAVRRNDVSAFTFFSTKY